MPTEEAKKLAENIQAELNTSTVTLKSPNNNPDDSLIVVRGAGNNFLSHELAKLMEYAKGRMPMVYSNEEGLFFMFT